jgi:DNA (cytosine-5)-methyltransferase 1
MTQNNIIDLFAGCGGLLDGFMQSGFYTPVASVEWEKAPLETLKNRLEKKWKIESPQDSCICFDLQRIEELTNGFKNDEKYGDCIGLDNIIGAKKIDLVIGGPPCQAYSVAGRIRDKNNMKRDYRNYLFEYYLKIVEKYQPKAFVFENVPGMLSAMPDGTLVTELIERDIESKGYEIIKNISKYAVVDMSEFGVPQQRRRVILIGLNKNHYKGHNIQGILLDFYCNILPKNHKKRISTKEAINDLPACYPNINYEVFYKNGKKFSHSNPDCEITWQKSRYHSKRDIQIFEMLAKDIESGENIYANSAKLNEIYNKHVGGDTKVHKYHVLRPDLPSTTILAHLYKDGLRFIHYNSEQARSITVREAARLQSFDDDFEFLGTQGDAFKMIGNAVPPKFAYALASSLNELFLKYK